MGKQPEIVSAQAWKCPCGRVVGREEYPVCPCGEWSLDGPVKAEKAAPKAEPKVEAKPSEEDGGFTVKTP